MKKLFLVAVLLALVLPEFSPAATTEAPAVQPATSPEISSPEAGPASGKPGSFLSDLAQFTHDASVFLGNAIETMTVAMQYLYGGIGVASTFQQGFNQANDICVNGPPALPFPLPGQPAPPASPATQARPEGPSNLSPAGPEAESVPAEINPSSITTKQFRDDLNVYKQLGLEEKNVLSALQANPNDTGLQEIQKQIQAAKKERMSRILLALAYDIETRKYEKLHFLVEYLNTEGPETIKIFYEIINETKAKLQISFINAGNFGMTLSLEEIDGKLQLVLSIGTGSGTPEPLPTVPLEPAGGQAPQPGSQSGDNQAGSPSEPENSPGTSERALSNPAKGVININTASQAEFEKLPFLGKKMAERIIEYRNTKGAFNSIEELKNIPGIGEKKFEKIKDYLTK